MKKKKKYTNLCLFREESEKNKKMMLDYTYQDIKLWILDIYAYIIYKSCTHINVFYYS